MTAGKRCLTPLAAVAGGLLAGAVGTVCLDTVQYLRHRRAGGQESPLAWEFAPVETWAQARSDITADPRVRRTRERLPSNGFIESAPEHGARALVLKCALRIKHERDSGAIPTALL